MKRRHTAVVLSIATFLLAMAATGFAQQQSRFALVVGNSDYVNLARLKNPVNDATDMATELRSLGFHVELLIDANLEKMEQGVIHLGSRLAGSPDAVGFFYYAGHGVQSGGINYLIPTDAEIPGEAFLKTKALPVQALLDTFQTSGNKLNIIVLDACRNNPFSWARSATRGLTVVGRQPPGSIIAYATGAGGVARDGSGRNGTFTGALLKNLNTPGQDIHEVLRLTGAEVQAVTKGAQTPAVYDQFFGQCYLAGAPASATHANTHVQKNDATMPYILAVGSFGGDPPEYWNGRKACVWVNGERKELPVPTTSSVSFATSVYRWNSSTYIAGFHGYGTSNFTACYWKDGKRIDLSVPGRSGVAYAASIFVVDGTVYVGGSWQIGNDDLTSTACYWVNGRRTDLPVPAKAGSASPIFVKDGKVYVAGWYYNAAGTGKSCYWIDGQRHDLSTPAGNTLSFPRSIYVANDVVYVAGGYGTSWQRPFPCYWANGRLVDLPGATGVAYGGSIFVTGNDVYVTGNYLGPAVPTVRTACYWLNGRLHNLPSRSSDAAAGQVFIYDGAVYISGNDQGPCYWKNEHEVLLSGSDQDHARIASLFVGN